MSHDNPYAGPVAPPGRTEDIPSMAWFLAKWGLLTALNAVMPLSLAPDSVVQGRDKFPIPLGLPSFSLPQAIVGIATIAVALALLDAEFHRCGQASSSKALTYGAIAKGLLQFAFVVDFVIGIIAVGLVNLLPGRGGHFAVLFATLLCGMINAGVAYRMGVILMAFGGPRQGRQPLHPTNNGPTSHEHR